MNRNDIPTTIEQYRRLCDATRGNNARRDATMLLGEIGESICLTVASEAKFKIIFLAKTGGGGPALALGKEKTILPDFELRCTSHRYGAYLDAKVKAGPIFAYTKRQWRHGIDQRNWEQYVGHGEAWEQAAGLFLLECFTDAEKRDCWSGSILMQSLKELGTPYSPLGIEDPPKVYWRRSQFRELGHYSPEQWAKMAAGSWAPDLEQHFHAIFDARKQQPLFV